MVGAVRNCAALSIGVSCDGHQCTVCKRGRVLEKGGGGGGRQLEEGGRFGLQQSNVSTLLPPVVIRQD